MSEVYVTSLEEGKKKKPIQLGNVANGPIVEITLTIMFLIHY